MLKWTSQFSDYGKLIEFLIKDGMKSVPTKAYVHFLKNLDTVTRLRGSYDIVRTKRGSKGKGAFDHITRSAILFLASSFEVYIEDVTIECCEQHITRAHDAKKLPHDVISNLNEYTKRDKTPYSPIDLCDEGWRTVYKTMVTEATSKLNTPKTTQIKDLFKRYVGISNNDVDGISRIDELDAFVQFRGEITHRVKATNYVSINQVEEYEGLVKSLVISIDTIMLEFFKRLYPNEKIPWRNTY